MTEAHAWTMRKFQKLMLSHRCVCMRADLHPHAYQQQLKWTRNQKNSPGSSKKTAIHRKPQRYPAYPEPPTSMLWTEVPSIINRNGCFFLKAAKHKIQKTTLNWGTGGHDLCGVVLHGMAVFFEEPGMCWFDICYDLIWYDVIWYDLIWFDIWYDMVWYDMIWFDLIHVMMIWYDVIWYDMSWYYMIWFDMIWFDMIYIIYIIGWFPRLLQIIFPWSPTPTEHFFEPPQVPLARLPEGSIVALLHEAWSIAEMSG